MHLQRTLLPILLLLLPLMAIIAVIAAHRNAALLKKKQSAPIPTAHSNFGTAQWPIFRGNPQLNGLAEGNLPDQLTIAWKFKTGGPVKAAPIVAAGKVFAPSTDRNIYALDPNTGTLLWQKELDGEIEASAMAADQTVYVGTTNGWFYALDAESGSIQWKYETKGKIAASANFVSGQILFGDYEGVLHALSPQGKLLWSYKTESYLNGTPAASQSAILIGGCDANLHILSLHEPNQVRRIDTGSYIPSSPAVYEPFAYVGNFSGQILSIRIQTAEIAWTSSRPDDAFFAAPAVNDSCLVIGSQSNKLLCLDRQTGQIRWTFQTEGAVNSSPVLCGTSALFGCDDGFLRIVSLTDGKERWSANLAQPISSPAVAANRIFVGCGDGCIYAWKQKDQQ
ncbi:MAG TPA: PQQ-binding-like beta-propeller repeat protein [Anaerohalosphaeraceae bacterium]|nr:PQQ-binding-like beta-propeller repeat protein [Anaerohalosphaeraceae bacterium]